MPDDLSELDDATLMTRHLDGDESAFGVLVARHRDRAWSVALRTLGDPVDAADAVQDAFLSAFRSAGSFRSEAKFSTWLHRIVVNACLDRMRRARVRPAVALDDATAAAVADPYDAFAASDLSVDISSALSRIGADQRVAVVLVDVHGMAVDEAAAVLGVPTGTVKSRCHRGRAALAAQLGHLRPSRGTGPGGGASNQESAPPSPSNPTASPTPSES
ncbi:MAG TPA: RNA polymerase sigma factor SigM [Mycobacteriales bacterium]|nr:RNA polymerase sigma factor SigM [Mycobacteriales bacterium]